MKNFLTEEERSKILELRSSNVSIYNISKQIHRNRTTVANFINNPEEYVKEMEEYLAMPEEARRAISKPRIIKRKPANPANLKKFLTEAEREKIDAMRTEGKSVTSIATLIGRGSSTIKTYIENPEGYEEFINKSITEQANLKKKLPNLLAKQSRLKILKLKESGLSPSKIARKLRKSHESVVAFLKNPDEGEYEKFISNIKTTPKAKTVYEFEAKSNGYNRTTVKRYLSEEERSKIQEMRQQNNSLKTISRLMHRSLDTINTFLRDPKMYEEEVNAYKEFRLSRKSRKSNNNSYKMLNDSLSEEDLKNYNKVSLEHRSVIKYLVKKGTMKAKSIFEELRKVYGKSSPDINLVTYWAQQFQQGRHTIVNETKSTKSSEVLERPNGILSSSIINGSSNSNGGSGAKRPPVKLKLFQFKLKPLKRLAE